MRSSKRRMKSPVGNMIKRGAELEGTPRTPRTLDFSPVRSISGNGCQEIDGHNRQARSRKPLSWSTGKQGFSPVRARNDDTPENPLARRYQDRFRELGSKYAELALSPICVNAITACAHQQGQRHHCKQKCTDNPINALSKQSFSPKASKHRPDNNVSLTHGSPDHSFTIPGRKESVRDEGGAFTEGSCPSSPECPSLWMSGAAQHGVVIWNNAAFQPGSVARDRLCSRDFGSQSSSSSASSSNLVKTTTLESKASGEDCRKVNEAVQKGGEDILPNADTEIEDYTTDADSKLAANRIAKDENAHDNFRDGIVHCEGHETRDGCRNCELPNDLVPEIVCNKREEDDWSMFTDRPETLNRSVARKVLFIPGDIALDQSVIKESCGLLLEAGNKSARLSASEQFVKGECSLESRPLFLPRDGRNHNEDAVETAVFEAQKDHFSSDGLSKLRRETKKCKQVEEGEVDINTIEEEIQRLKKRLSELQLQKQRLCEGRKGKRDGAGFKRGANARGNGGKTDAGRGGKVKTSQSPQLLRRCASLGSSSLRGREDSPVVQARKKLAEGSLRGEDSNLRGRRLAKRIGTQELAGGAPPPTLAAGGAPPPFSAATSVSEKKNVFRRLSLSVAIAAAAPAAAPSPKPAPRFVSSRYSQPPTPDPPPSKKRQRASSTPKYPPASNSSPVPLKKLTTIRSGYPSPTGFSTPLKSRIATPLPPISALTPATTTPPRSVPRVQGFKSTAALSECFESLVHDTKQFFKNYPRTNTCSPARDAPSAAKSSFSKDAKSLREAKQGSSDKLSVRRQQAMSQLQTISPIKPFETPTKGSLYFAEAADGLDSERRSLPRINTSRIVGLSPRDSGCVKRMPDRQKKQSYFAPAEIDRCSQAEVA